jgi:sugar transferase (PEP-CTERM/EpsH1 system associated)
MRMDGRIHIQHVLLSLRPGGLENGVVNVVNGLDPGGFRSSICCLQQAGEFAARLRPADARVHEMGLRGGNDLALPLRLACLFRRTAPDIVHTRNAEAFFYGVLGARLAGVPAVVHSEHGRTLPDKPRRMWLQRRLTPLADAVFAVSAQLRDDLVRHVRLPAARIEVLHNGVDLAGFAAGDAGRRARARDRLGVSPDQPVVGSVGRLAAVKNYALLLRAFAALAAPRGVLALVGEGPERAALERLGAELGLGDRLRLLGHRDDVRELLPGLDVFVLPSLSEGMSNTLLEAMACGVAVVASAVGGNAEIVRDGSDGLLFDSGDLEGLIGRLRLLTDAPPRRAELARAARARVEQEFGFDAMIRRYEDLYRRLLRAR